jgi:nucleotidyltransferase substrate binding protein (TIGR01987 family)
MDKEIFNSFGKSLQRLEEILKAEKTVANRDSAIKRFEFTVELAWKSIQKFLRGEEIICRSPKECLKEAFKFGLVEDDPKWIEMFEDRNLTAHMYNEKTAEEVYNRLPGYINIFNELRDKFKEN